MVSNNTLAGSIVTTIKPIYSLVSHLTEGVDEPILLMKQNQSPHHYSMRPSERRLLADAKMIIWVGPQMESFLSKVIKQQKSTTVISVIQATGLTLLNKRTAHNNQKSHAHEDQQHVLGNIISQNIDPHIWLSTNNAIAISKYITQQLVAFNPDHSKQYQQNLQQLLNKIEQTKNFITTQLNSQPNLRNTAFIAYHDAFQYFEDEHSLNYIDSINFSDEAGTSLKHIRHIKTLIDKDNIQCLIYQAPKPAIIKALTKKTAIKASELDPLGLNSKDDKNAWFELMRQLALDFSFCLSS